MPISVSKFIWIQNYLQIFKLLKCSFTIFSWNQSNSTSSFNCNCISLFTTILWMLYPLELYNSFLHWSRFKFNTNSIIDIDNICSISCQYIDNIPGRSSWPKNIIHFIGDWCFIGNAHIEYASIVSWWFARYKLGTNFFPIIYNIYCISWSFARSICDNNRCFVAKGKFCAHFLNGLQKII